MIYTVTFNPSLDYYIHVNGFQYGSVNRAATESVRVGGKGVNVSVMLTRMGVPNTALGFVSGFTGEQIRAEMKAQGCTTEFLELPDGFSRINVKMTSELETEINGQGPSVSEDEFNELLFRISQLKAGDTLVLAGSIPASLPKDSYERILDKIDTNAINVVVDTNSYLLRSTLAYHPFLIKPNLQEIGELFGRKLTESEDIIACAQHLQEEGARNVLVSMGSQGALLVTEEGHIIEAPAPKGDVVDTIGAGDAMVAGFLAGYRRSHSYVDGFRYGLMAGSATAFTEGLATTAQIAEILQRA